MERSESYAIGKEPCPKCGSTDNLVRYSDGHAHCFTQGCKHWEPASDEPIQPKRKASMSGDIQFLTGTPVALSKRKLSEQTCSKWGYVSASMGDKPVQVATYIKDGEIRGQKIRFADKTFTIKGKIADCLYGQHLWQAGGKKIVVTEGEIDALSVSQVQGNKWPVVSIPQGAAGAKKSLAANLEWLESFEQVILMFDMDDAGKAAVEECAPLFSKGKCHVAKLPLKDANDMLVKDRSEELVRAIWGAQVYRPDGLVSMKEVKERAKTPIAVGLAWCFPTLNTATYGRRFGEIYAVGAGTGVGKTDFLLQQIALDIDLGYMPALFLLEQPTDETALRLAGKRTKKAYHVPDADWTVEEKDAAIDALPDDMVLYDSFGANDWEVIKSKIRYLANEGTRIFYLDHLTALADSSNERESIEQIMKEMAGLAMELQIIITFVSHLSTPEGKSHEEGGRVMIKHFKGSRTIGMWSHFMFALERDQQSEDEEVRNRTTFRILKDRKTGRATGVTFGLSYDFASAYLVEASQSMFGDEPDSNKDF